MKDGEFLNCLSDYQLLQKESVMWDGKYIFSLQGPMAEPCKCGNKPLAYTKGEKFIKLTFAPGIRIMGMVKRKTSCTACPRNRRPKH
jgi:hypothetical protein